MTATAKHRTTKQKCELSGVVVTSIPSEAWINDQPYRCHACGTLTRFRVRDTDRAGQARLHTHYFQRTDS